MNSEKEFFIACNNFLPGMSWKGSVVFLKQSLSTFLPANSRQLMIYCPMSSEIKKGIRLEVNVELHNIISVITIFTITLVESL